MTNSDHVEDDNQRSRLSQVPSCDHSHVLCHTETEVSLISIFTLYALNDHCTCEAQRSRLKYMAMARLFLAVEQSLMWHFIG